MRMFNAWVVITGVLAGLTAALVVVFTHEARIPPAMAVGLVDLPAGVDYEIPRQPTTLIEMERVLAGDQATHFDWWTFMGEMKLATGDRPGAMRAWRRGADLAIEASQDPNLERDHWRPAYRAGWNLWRLGETDEAQLWMRQTLDSFERQAMWALTRDRNSNGQPAGQAAPEDDTGEFYFAGLGLYDLHFLGFTKKILGDDDGAVEAFTEMMERQAANTVRGNRRGGQYYYELARIMAKVGDRESALLAFEAAARHWDFPPGNAWWTPSFETIRNDPRFRAVLEGEIPPGDTWPEIGPPLTGDPRGSRRNFNG